MMAKKDKITNDNEPTKKIESSFGIIHQYIKDSSFENIITASEIINTELNPTGNISLSVNTEQVQENIYEVMIKIKVDAKDKKTKKNVYITELEYVGLAQVEGFEESEKSGILMVEVPRLLFPYIRNNIAHITQEGGFQPLVLEPVNFMGMWIENMEQQK